MNDDERSKALDAIHDKALHLFELLPEGSPPELAEGLELIVALARHKFDVRSVNEI